MIKLNIFFRRKAGLSHEEFSRHWRKVHAPLFLRQPEALKFCRRYVQNDSTPAAFSSVERADYDGIAEMWFESLDDAKALFTSDNYKNNIQPDEEFFLDPGSTRYVFTETNVILDKTT